MSGNTMEQFMQLVKRVKDEVYKPLNNLEIEMWWTKEPVPFAERLSGRYQKLEVGQKWGELWDCAWMKLTGEVPAEAAGHKVVLLVDVGGEGCVFDAQGTPLRGITCIKSEFDLSLGMPGKRVLQFLTCACGGEKVDFWLEAGMNDLFGRNPENGELVQACFATCNTAIRDLFYDLHVLTDLFGAMEEGYRRNELAGALGRVEKILDELTPEKVAEAKKVTEKALDHKNSGKAMTFSAIGHAHIDLAWLWPIRETKRKGGRSFATVIELMDRYPDYKFGASQPQLYQWAKEMYPGLYEKIKQKIKEGRWEVQGALWVECDTNVTGAEAFVRQLLYGKKFYRDEFGIDVKTLWLPDAFGFTAALPQLMKLSGTDYFTTIKMSWSVMNKFPYSSFRWKGVDGTSVLAHIPPEGTYNSSANPSAMIKAAKNFNEKDVSDEALLLFGIGDGGGGPGPEHLERIDREHDLDGMPKIQYEFARDFFHRLEKVEPQLPEWRGEMYLERHQGTFTSQAKNKYYNRKLEIALQQAEYYCRLAERETGMEYPEEEFVTIWKELLLYQFHDILPGSSIKRVYDESCERYAIMLQQAEGLKAKALAGIAEKLDTAGLKAPEAIFNGTSWERQEWLKSTDGWLQVSVPAMGHAVLEGGGCSDNAFAGLVNGNIVENDKVRITLNENGFLDSVILKSNGMEMLKSGTQGNLLGIHQDGGDAWDILPDYLKLPMETPVLVSRTCKVDGPKVTVTQSFTYGDSRIEQDMVLTDGSARVDFVTRVDWQESGKMLRVKFPAAIDVPQATCEIQFGHVYRPTHSSTSWDLAKFEVSHHRWVDVSTPGCGLALLNDCKYGSRIAGCVLDLNLLRSTNYPGVDADKGQHTFTYALFPHEGDHVAGEVVREAYALNIPLERLALGVHEGSLPKMAGNMTLTDNQIVIESVKRSEDGKATVVRLYEASGSYRKTEFALGTPAATVNVVNLMEENAVPLEMKQGVAELSFHPFEIKTLYILGA